MRLILIMNGEDAMKIPDESRVIATSTLCTVEEREDGLIDIQLGHVVFRLHKRELASLSGTLQRVVRQVFPRKPHAETEGRVLLRLVRDDE